MIGALRWLQTKMASGPCAAFFWLGGSLALLASGCTESASAPAPVQPIPKVTVAEVVSQETIDYDQYVGRAEASETVELRSRVNGFLQEIKFRDGDQVVEGQPLFLIEPDKYEAIHKQSLAKINICQAQLELAQTKLARDEKLLQKGAVPREEYEEALAAVQECEAQIIAAKADSDRTALDVKYTTITSPISGRIDRTLVNKGNLVTGGTGAGTLLTTIVRIVPIYVYFDVDERSLLRYQRMGQAERNEKSPQTIRDQQIPCYVQLSDEENFPHRGQLDFAANRVDPTTGTIKIRGVFENQDHQLTPGMFVHVRVPTSDKYQALLIPEQAIATDQSIKYVYVVDSDQIVSRRNLKLGPSRGDLRTVRSGLKAGDRVIVKGLQRVRPGQQVEATLEPLTVATP